MQPPGRASSPPSFGSSLDETFDIGEATGTPVGLTYDVPHHYSDGSARW